MQIDSVSNSMYICRCSSLGLLAHLCLLLLIIAFPLQLLTSFLPFLFPPTFPGLHLLCGPSASASGMVALFAYAHIFIER